MTTELTELELEEVDAILQGDAWAPLSEAEIDDILVGPAGAPRRDRVELLIDELVGLWR